MNGTRVVSVVAALVMASMASGATVWNPAANGIFPPDVGNWNDGFNWTEDVPGVFEGKAVFNVLDAAEAQVTDTQFIDLPGGQWVQGDNGPGGVIRVMDGGSLSMPGGDVWAAVGYNNSAHLIVETGGVVDFSNHMWVAFVLETGFFEDERPIVDINGGTVNVGGMFGIGWQIDDFAFLQRGIGYVNVNDGGLLALTELHADRSISPESVLNISGTGAVTIPGDSVNVMNGYIDAGSITANGGADPVDVRFDVDADLTTLKALAPFGADFDEDGDVDGNDFLLWQVGFGANITSGATKMDGDYDNDGDVDGNDFLGWQVEFPSPGSGAGSAAVPEPATLVLVIFMGLVAMCRFRTRA